MHEPVQTPANTIETKERAGNPAPDLNRPGRYGITGKNILTLHRTAMIQRGQKGGAGYDNQRFLASVRL